VLNAIRDNLRLLIRGGQPLVGLETTEEARTLKMLDELAAELRRPLFEWSVTTGLRPRPMLEPLAKPVFLKAVEALQYALRPEAAGQMIIFKDLSPHLREPIVERLLRDLSQQTSCQAFFVEAKSFSDVFRQMMVTLEIPLPNAEELDRAVREAFLRIRSTSVVEVSSSITKREYEHLVQTLRGLTEEQAVQIITAAIYQDNALTGDDLPRIVEAKRQRLQSSGCLESILVDVEIEQVGGFANLKRWLKQRRNGFSEAARKFGLDSPRGMLLLGVQGCGKSLCAKMVASDWGMPLLRLDPGLLYNRFVGETESRLRNALSQAEAMAPAVLWIDEIEKAFASASSDSADGGLSQRMFGSLLTWMQDHRMPIFIVATANNVERLPPELMRKGRFDEVFFVDLPIAAARRHILSIHLDRRGKSLEPAEMTRLVEATEGYSGAELEQLIVAGLFSAFQADRTLRIETLIEESTKTRPLSVLMGEKIANLRRWASDRCVPADDPRDWSLPAGRDKDPKETRDANDGREPFTVG
jgi:ATP-dependent 26S proteasome regulatory subunit